MRRRLAAVLIAVAILLMLIAPLLTRPLHGQAISPAPAARLTTVQQQGLALKYYRMAVGFSTQGELARVTGVPAATISLLERGLQPLDSALTQRLGATILARYDSIFDAVPLNLWLMQVMGALRPQPPAPPPPAPNPWPQRGVANGRMNGQPLNTYRLNALKHGYVDGTRVVIRYTGAGPNVDMHIFYVRVPNVDEVWLYRDSAFTVPVVVTANGMGGTIQRLP